MLPNHNVDKRTGFLTPTPAFVGVSLSSDQKLAFLKEYAGSFNMTKAAESVFTTRALIAEHMKEDKVFAEAVQAAVDGMLDDVEESIYRQSKKSPIAAMQLLRAKRAKEWGMAKKPTDNAVDRHSDKLKALLNEPE